MMSFGLGSAILSVLAYYIKSYQVCVLTTFFIPAFLLNLQIFIIQDSP
jgi:hypothetical protein